MLTKNNHVQGHKADLNKCMVTIPQTILSDHSAVKSESNNKAIPQECIWKWLKKNPQNIGLFRFKAH